MKIDIDFVSVSVFHFYKIYGGIQMRAKVHQDIYIGIFISLLCIVFLLITTTLPRGAAVFPALLLIILLLLAGWIIWDGVRKTKSAKTGSTVDNTISYSKIRVPAVTYLYICGYIALFKLVGYFIATAIFMIAIMRRFHEKSWKKNIAITAGFIFIIFALFVKQLNVPVLNFGYLEQFLTMLR